MPLFAQNTHPMTFDDMMKIKRVGSPKLSPDGKWIAYTVATVNKAANRSNADIWMMPAGGGEARQLTNYEKSDTDPCWSPDSKSLAFVSNRDGVSQVWLLSLKGGEPRKVTNFYTDIGGLIWSPDGAYMAFTADIYPECPTDDCNAAKLEAADKSKVKAKTADRLLFRHWTSFKEGKRSHIFVVPASGGPAKDVTPGDFDAPPFNLGGTYYNFSPDGKELAFVCNTDKDEAISTNNDIFVVPSTGGNAKRLSTGPGSDINPVYSPDGKYLAWTSQPRATFEADRRHILIYDRAAQQIRDLTATNDVSADELAWSLDNKKIFFCANDKAQSSIFSVTLAGNDAKVVFPTGTNGDVNVTADGTLIFAHSNLSRPNEIYSVKADGSGLTQLTHVNDALFETLKLGAAEDFWFEGAAKAKVQALVVKPPQFEPGKKYPLLFLIHGGPQGAWENGWSYRWNPQLFASPGYVVVMVNPRGSTGYGQQFTDEISGDWGGKVYEDLMKGLDHAISLGYIDENRMGAAGGSYGGYMVNWILGHNNRFKALLSHAGVYNLESMYGVTEELWFTEWEFKGTPWDNPELYSKWSPHKSAKNFKTPTLVVHGELDYRVPVGEGLQLFTALQRQHVPSKLLYFPDEGHWVLKPQNSELWYKTMHEWFATYLKP
ncbi:MAG: S9 family peptidase [Blastocatellia bacterium]|nr:S9 family peptidase [Blastocatellia bacterium]